MQQKNVDFRSIYEVREVHIPREYDHSEPDGTESHSASMRCVKCRFLEKYDHSDPDGAWSHSAFMKCVKCRFLEKYDHSEPEGTETHSASMGCVTCRFLEKIRLICTCAQVESLGLYWVREVQIPLGNTSNLHLWCRRVSRPLWGA